MEILQAGRELVRCGGGRYSDQDTAGEKAERERGTRIAWLGQGEFLVSEPESKSGSLRKALGGKGDQRGSCGPT